MENIGYSVALFLFLLALSSFFSASETALTGANRIRLKHQTENGDTKAKRALSLIVDYDKTLVALLIGNNIVNILAAAITTVLFTALFGVNGVGIATLLVTVLVIIFGEVLPKSYANANSEEVIKFAALPLTFIKIIFTPFTKLLLLLKSSLSRNNKDEPEASLTEDELRVIIEEIEDEGVIEEDKSELLQSVLLFSQTTAADILTHRVDIVAADINADKDTLLRLFLEERFTRIPIYEKSIDSIVGVVNQKDFFTAIITGEATSIPALMQGVLHVPPGKHVQELMADLQRKKLHMAVVSDFYGGTEGIVTLEDILEELVGEIWDEHDDIVHMLTPLEGGGYEISGELELADLYKELLDDKKPNKYEANAVAGLALELLGHIPEAGESFETEQFIFTVAAVSDQRIKRLTCRIKTTNEKE